MKNFVSIGRRLALGTVLSVSGSNYSAGQSSLEILSLEELMSVEVTSASKKSQSLADVAAAIHVVSAEDIRRSGVSSLPEALRLVPGLNVARIDDTKWAVSSRGFNDNFTNKLLVLMDGRHIYTPSFAGVLWDTHTISIDNIERIEVIRGPGATLWGSNAVNGIINIISRDPRDTQGLLFQSRVGNRDTTGFNARYGQATENGWHYRFNLDSTSEDITESQLNFDAYDQWSHNQASFRVDGTPIENNTLRIEGAYYQSDSEETVQTLNMAEGIPSQPFQQQDMNTTGGWLMLDWEREFDSGESWNLKAYWDLVNRNMYLADYEQRTFSLDFQRRHLLGSKHDVVWGIGTRLAQLPFHRLSPNINVIDDEEGFQLFELFVQDEISLSEQFKLILGTKFENSEFVDTQVQPNVRLSWQPSDQLSLWASTSKAIRTPSIGESRLQITPSAPIPPFSQQNPLPLPIYTVLTGSDTKVEEMFAYELGVRGRVFGQLDFDLALFENHYDDLLGNGVDIGTYCQPSGINLMLDPTCLGTSAYVSTEIQIQSSMHAVSRGAELSLEWNASENWRLSGAFTLIDMDMDVENASPQVTGPGEPDWTVSMRSEWDVTSNLEFDLWLRAVDETPRFGVSSYTTADIRLGWRARPGLTVDLIGKNLLDNGHREFGSTLFESGPAGVMRSVVARVTWAP